jgi:hypothetical protein
MKCRLIIDSLGPNPDFFPPDPKIDPIGFQLYDVPHSITVPAGTELEEGPLAWVHCVPDAEGVIRAEPADSDCEAMVEKHLANVAAGRRKPLARVRREHEAHVAAAKALQMKSEKALIEKSQPRQM